MKILKIKIAKGPKIPSQETKMDEELDEAQVEIDNETASIVNDDAEVHSDEIVLPEKEAEESAEIKKKTAIAIEGKPLIFVLVALIIIIIVATAGFSTQILPKMFSKQGSEKVSRPVSSEQEEDKKKSYKKVEEKTILDGIVSSEASGYVGKTQAELGKKLGTVALDHNNSMSSVVWGKYENSDYEFCFINPSGKGGEPSDEWTCGSVDAIELADLVGEDGGLKMESDTLELRSTETANGVKYYLEGVYEGYNILIWGCDKDGNISKDAVVQIGDVQEVKKEDTSTAAAVEKSADSAKTSEADNAVKSKNGEKAKDTKSKNEEKTKDTKSKD